MKTIIKNLKSKPQDKLSFPKKISDYDIPAGITKISLFTYDSKIMDQDFIQSPIQ